MKKLSLFVLLAAFFGFLLERRDDRMMRMGAGESDAERGKS